MPSTLSPGEREDIISNFLNRAVEALQPEVVFLAGGGGAGKTTVIDKIGLAEEFGKAEGFVLVNPDEIKELMPEYQRLREAGGIGAVSVVHEESADVAQELLDRALAERKNVIYDGTMKDVEKGMSLIQRFRGAGYIVSMVGVTVDPHMAIARAKVRADQTGRHVPDEVLWDAHRGANSAFPKYALEVNHFLLYYSSEDPYVLAEAEDGCLLVHDPEAWDNVKSFYGCSN